MSLRTARETPLVSVVMSVFNGQRYLEPAVSSILAQSFRDFELLIVDDGSTDHTATILKRLALTDDRILLLPQGNTGLVEALNRGCSLARGHYIARMDADDIAHPTRLAEQVAFMRANPEVGVAGTDVEFMDAEGRAIAIEKQPVFSNEEIQRALPEHNVIFHPSVILRRALFEQVGGYRQVKDAEDYDLWLRLAEITQLRVMPTVLLRYRIHSSQVSTANRARQVLGAIAAQASSAARRRGYADPFDGSLELSMASLKRMGVAEAELHSKVARGYLTWLRNLYRSREYRLVIDTFRSLLAADCHLADKWILADSYLFAARAYWHEKMRGRSIQAFCRAVRTRPVMIARPLKSILSGR